jgi:hypothetical protein
MEGSVSVMYLNRARDYTATLPDKPTHVFSYLPAVVGWHNEKVR